MLKTINLDLKYKYFNGWFPMPNVWLEEKEGTFRVIQYTHNRGWNVIPNPANINMMRDLNRQFEVGVYTKKTFYFIPGHVFFNISYWSS
jgi:hypothetical protein